MPAGAGGDDLHPFGEERGVAAELVDDDSAGAVEEVGCVDCVERSLRPPVALVRGALEHDDHGDLFWGVNEMCARRYYANS